MAKWQFKNERGENVNPNEFIFAITSADTPQRPFGVIGTAFLIARPGVFLTARHCLFKDDACTDYYDGLVGILDKAHDFRWLSIGKEADVAIGQLEADRDFHHPVLTTCDWTPVKHEKVCHWGCDLTEISVLEQDGDLYRIKSDCKVRGTNGAFLESKSAYPPFTRSRCHVTSATTPHSASGGPVTLSTGQVVGISTSSSEGGGYSIASLVSDALNVQLPPHFRMNDDKKGRRQTFGELLTEFGFEMLRGS